MTILLDSGCLASKWGFEDGDLLGDLLYDHPARKEYVDDHLSFPQEVLARCVERFLLPALPVPVRTYRIGTCHNPIRAENDDHHLLPNPRIQVEISDADVLEVARDLGHSAPNSGVISDDTRATLTDTEPQKPR